MPTPIKYDCRGKSGYMFRFKRPDTGKRTTMRLGAVSKTQAVKVGANIDVVLESIKYNTDFPPNLYDWLSKLHPEIYDKFVRAGLLAPRENVELQTLGPFLSQYYELKTGGNGRSGGWKPGTATWRKHSMEDLKRHFGADKPLVDINAGDVEDWYRWLQQDTPEGRGLSAASASKKLKDARQFFGYAKKKGYIADNPFAEVRAQSQDNPERLCEVPRDSIEKVMKVIDDAEFRLIVALARYGGLRTPSEVSHLRWRDIDFESSQMHIFAPKTEHHRDGGHRTCPLFHELRPYLEAVRNDQCKPDDFVLQRLRGAGKNLRTQLLRYIKKAGLKPWPKPFQNLRANALTDLAEQHPIHVVCRWLGNSPDVAMRHYLLIKKKDYAGPSPESVAR